MSKSCVICENTNPATLFQRNGHNIVRCPDCGQIYLDYEPRGGEIKDLYSKDYFTGVDVLSGYSDYFACENYLKRNFRKRLAIIEKHRSGGNILDIGCGPGFFLETLSSAWSPYGVEVSGFAAEAARERKLQVINSEFNAGLFEPEFFDAVTMWNVFEHFPNPAAALRDSYRIMKPGGVIAIYTNNVESLFARITGKRWHMYLIPEHLFYFSRRGIFRLLEQEGFEVIKCHSETQFFSLDYLLEHFMKIFGTQYNRKRAPSWLMRILNAISLPVNFFDTITVYARKR